MGAHARSGVLTECRVAWVGGRGVCLAHPLQEADDCRWITKNGRRICITSAHRHHGTDAWVAEAKAYLDTLKDDPDLARGKAIITTGTPTTALYLNPDGSWQDERAALHEQLVEEILNVPGSIPAPGTAPVAILYAGAGGSGKTTSLGPFVPGDAKANYVVINADDIKAKLPEYNGYNAALVHEESSHVAESLATFRAIDQQRNLIFDGTGKTLDKYRDMAQRLQAAGYAVHLMYASVDPLESTKRAVKRFKDMVAKGKPNPRYVDPEYLLMAVDGKPDTTYNAMKASGFLDRAVKVDNNGATPKLLEDLRFHRPKVAAEAGLARSPDRPGGLPRGRVRGRGQAGHGQYQGADAHDLSEADDCKWVTIGGNRVCITKGHSTGGFTDKQGRRVYFHGGRKVPEGTPEAQQAALHARLRAPDGGFTYDPKTDSEPTRGFALSIHPERSKVLSAKTLTKADLVSYLDDNWDLLEQDGAHLGAWHDPATGKVYLDVSMVVKTAAEAATLALAHDQIAYFDLKAMKSVDVNRTAKSGQKT